MVGEDRHSARKVNFHSSKTCRIEIPQSAGRGLLFHWLAPGGREEKPFQKSKGSCDFYGRCYTRSYGPPRSGDVPTKPSDPRSGDAPPTASPETHTGSRGPHLEGMIGALGGGGNCVRLQELGLIPL